MYKTLLVLSLLIGCGKDNSPLLISYANEFIAEGAKRGVSVDLNKMLSLRYGKTSAGADGTCKRFKPTGQYEITINKRILNAANYTRLHIKALVFHELGHCALGLKHSGDNNIIMHRSITRSQRYFKDNWDYLMDQLFDNV